MTELTTAQRLATYREELRAAGFTHQEVRQLVEQAAPSLTEDVIVAQPQLVVFEPSGGSGIREAVTLANAQRAARLTKRTISVVGGLLRVEDEYADSSVEMRADSQRIEVEFTEDGGTNWSIYRTWPPPSDLYNEQTGWVRSGLISEDGAPTDA
ncbi:hypothetical protein ACIBCT_21140 [Streptosporangium sp. NPDC050855]|uniref:hypothetical protein n=1 Tax=Streptosporangium sp. NPDC050855 TaxID=3366194 RepID=UPI0037B99AC3